MSETEPGPGHNSLRVAQKELQDYARRLMKLEDDKKEAAAEHSEAIKEVKAEAKGRGYDVKLLGAAMKLMRLEDDQRAVLHVYCEALDVFA